MTSMQTHRTNHRNPSRPPSGKVKLPLRKVYVIPVVLLAALLALVGCESPGGGPGPFSSSGPPPDFMEMPEVIARVNQNSAAMNFLMRGGGVNATGEYLKNGKKESFELKGTLLY